MVSTIHSGYKFKGALNNRDVPEAIGGKRSYCQNIPIFSISLLIFDQKSGETTKSGI